VLLLFHMHHNLILMIAKQIMTGRRKTTPFSYDGSQASTSSGYLLAELTCMHSACGVGWGWLMCVHMQARVIVMACCACFSWLSGCGCCARYQPLLGPAVLPAALQLHQAVMPSSCCLHSRQCSCICSYGYLQQAAGSSALAFDFLVVVCCLLCLCCAKPPPVYMPRQQPVISAGVGMGRKLAVLVAHQAAHLSGKVCCATLHGWLLCTAAQSRALDVQHSCRH
jgi:hypothetical protein